MRSSEDVVRLRRELQERKCPARIIVKIEKPQAVQHLEEIIAVTDCVMVARGDLGVEMDVQRVPAIQKRIIALCNQAHRPVITATQMLNSMEHSSRPTRAEASDVFNAVLDGTDAVMLSGESAVGEYPVEAVVTMGQICSEAEAYMKSAAVRTRWVDFAVWVDRTDYRGRRGCCAPDDRAIGGTTDCCVDRVGSHGCCPEQSQTNGDDSRPNSYGAIARTLALCWGVMPLVRPGPYRQTMN